MPNKKSKPHAASNRNHDTGLIAPGKRVVKQRSVQQLARNANGKPTAPTSQTVHADSSLTTSSSPPELLIEDEQQSDSDYMGSFSRSTEERGGNPRHAQNGSAGSHVNTALSAGEFACSDSTGNEALVPGCEEAVSPLIGNHTRWDVVAMFLLLLQLPAGLQLLVEVPFALMLFGNDTNNWLARSLRTETLLRSHGGNPSLATTLLTDVIAMIVWLFFPSNLQGFAVDLALVVVAVCLAGAATTRDSWKNPAICIMAIAVSHFFRAQHRREDFSHYIWVLLSRLSMGGKFTPLPSRTGPPHERVVRDWVQRSRHLAPVFPDWVISWVQSITGIHIFVYGLSRSVRYYVENQNQKRSPNKVDLELAHVNGSAGRPSTQDATVDGARNTSTDGRPPGPYPIGRDKQGTSGRRRKKQAAFVRIQQPFWAAVAQAFLFSTKNSDISQASQSSFEVDRKDRRQSGSTRGQDWEDEVVITSIGESEIGFSAELKPCDDAEVEEQLSPDRERRGSLGSKFLEVHINGTKWRSVDCKDEPPNEEHPDTCMVEGKIVGLTPQAIYKVNMVKVGEQSIVYQATITTRPAARSDNNAAGSATPQDSIRPQSPSTALRTSIAAVENNLVEHKAKATKSHKARSAQGRSLKQELSELSEKLQTCGTDDRQRQRQLQYRQNIKQAEVTTKELSSKLANLGEVPKADKQAYEESKKKHKAVVDRNAELKKAVEAAKRDSQKATSDAHSENAKLKSKREKAENRLNTLNERRNATADENDARHAAKTQSELRHRDTIEYHRQLQLKQTHQLRVLNQTREDHENGLRVMQQQQYYDSPMATQYGAHYAGNPHTPDSSNASMAQPHRGFLPGLGFQQQSVMPGMPAMHSRQNSVRKGTRRDRSSSMLSTVSGLTDDAIGNQAYEGSSIPRNTSASSGAASSHTPNSPRPRLSPIGSEMGRGSPRNNKK